MSKPPRAKVKFPNPDHVQGQKDLYKELRRVIIDLRSLMTKGGDMHLMISFTNVINPGSFFDEGRLPLVSENGKTKCRRKAACILARVSQAILMYWKYALAKEGGAKDQLKVEVEGYIALLRLIHKQGLDAYKMVGDENVGYELALAPSLTKEEEVEEKLEEEAEETGAELEEA